MKKKKVNSAKKEGETRRSKALQRLPEVVSSKRWSQMVDNILSLVDVCDQFVINPDKVLLTG